MFSIDQNCHSLWDVLPKLAALARRGVRVRHFLEDLDAAFTAIGSHPDNMQMRIARERFHHSGGADWGAAMFYTEFLGRLPVDIRDWEPITGMKTGALARQLGLEIDQLYDKFSPSDNWQLIGPSYVGDRDHHRLIGDLSVAETGEFIRQMMQIARKDMLRAFPAEASQRRIGEWFDREEALVESLLECFAGGSLIDLYRAWMRRHLGDSVEMELSSALFAIGRGGQQRQIMELFLVDYDTAAGLYNEAVQETDTKLRPLKTAEGELPFFAAMEYQGRLVRTGANLDGDSIRLADKSFKLTPQRKLPIDELARGGVRCLAGKAALLVIQARLGPDGAPLALPYRGSAYMPTADLLAQKLRSRGLLPGELHPVFRIKFGLLERMRSLETVIRLPAHLAAAMGREEVPARLLSENCALLIGEARQRLEKLSDPTGRRQWQGENFPEIIGEIDQLNAKRKALARTDPKCLQIREMSQRVRSLQSSLLERTILQIDRDWQVRELDYYDSRGAIWPWALALGGESFYNELLDNAEIYEQREQ